MKKTHWQVSCGVTYVNILETDDIDIFEYKVYNNYCQQPINIYGCVVDVWTTLEKVAVGWVEFGICLSWFWCIWLR